MKVGHFLNGMSETAHPLTVEGIAATAKSLGLEVDGSIEIAGRIDIEALTRYPSQRTWPAMLSGRRLRIDRSQLLYTMPDRHASSLDHADVGKALRDSKRCIAEPRLAEARPKSRRPLFVQLRSNISFRPVSRFKSKLTTAHHAGKYRDNSRRVVEARKPCFARFF